jgi:adenine-specific DNA methylase
MLFEEFGHFHYQFPEPQYLGSKHLFVGWIAKHLPSNVRVVLDVFGGSQSVAFMLKQRGLQTLTNDLLRFNHMIGLALIENEQWTLSNGDIQMLFEPCSHEQYRLMQDVFTNVFFDATQAAVLDHFRYNVNRLENPYKQALALAVMNRSMTRKVIMGHFAHTKALAYAKNPARVKRNPSIARPVRDLFIELLPKYNNAVFSNRQQNKSFQTDALQLLPTLSGVELAYFDPPYCDSHANYQSFYHLLETYVEYWHDKQFVNATKRYEPQKPSGFDKKQDAIESFETLFASAADIPHWLISYNNRSYPSPEILSQLIRRYKDVTVEAQTYVNGRGGKGSVAGSKELLFICKHRPSFFVQHTFSQQSMPQSFEYWKQRFEKDELEEFTSNTFALLWLKVKSITRRNVINEAFTHLHIQPTTQKLDAQFKELYETLCQSVEKSHHTLNQFIRQKHYKQSELLNEELLVSELYQLKVFDWGGDYKNALDRYLVDKYIKVYPRYQDITRTLEQDIPRAVEGYVLCSWYNHWSSILIEHLFKSHPNVLPTVGQIKKVDFFVNEIPFDLKFTYLPDNFIEAKRKARGLGTELAELKHQAKAAGITFSTNKSGNDTYYEIIEKMRDRNDEQCQAALASIKAVRLQILQEAQSHPRELIQNLYEEQGELRFDASNRLFLVLVDSEDFDNSWKLKRNLDALRPSITKYLDDFPQKRLEDLQCTFTYKKRSQSYTAYSDVLFIVR